MKFVAETACLQGTFEGSWPILLMKRWYQTPGSQPPIERWQVFFNCSKRFLEKSWCVKQPLKDGAWTSRNALL